jgi:hypothetical protein
MSFGIIVDGTVKCVRCFETLPENNTWCFEVDGSNCPFDDSLCVNQLIGVLNVVTGFAAIIICIFAISYWYRHSNEPDGREEYVII